MPDKIDTPEKYKKAQCKLEDLGTAFAKGEDLPGDEEEGDCIEKLMSESDYEFDMDTGAVVKK